MAQQALAIVALVLASALAGCSSDQGGPEPTGSTSDFRRPPPREVFSEQGNNAQCTEVLAGEQVYDFAVEEGYDTIEVQFHASGLGQVGYEITGPDGAVVADVPDSNPQSQPCTHGHSGLVESFPATPGAYQATVRNTGILGWIFVVNEVSTARATPSPTPG